MVETRTMIARIHELADELKQYTPTHVVICLSGLSVHTNGSPIFGAKVYGPFTENEVERAAKTIGSLEGGAVLVRPLVDLTDTLNRISAD